MPDAPTKLTALAHTALAALPTPPGSRGWAAAFQAMIARAHTAAYMVGVAERTGVDPRGLSRAERDDVKAAVKAQLAYLDGFLVALPELSEAQIAARTELYAGTVRGSFWQARTNNALPVYPGGCPQCYGRCRCSVAEQNGAWYWNSTNDKTTCDGCRERGAAWQPYRGDNDAHRA